MATCDQQDKPAVRHEAPLGSSGTDVIGKIHNQDDHIDGLKGSEANSFYDKMHRSDTQVRKAISAVNYPIKAAEWSIEPASDDAKDLEAAALIEQILFKDISWSKFMHEVLTFYLHGFAAFEVVHKNRVNKETGPYTGLAQLAFRKQNTITEWTHDKVTGELLAVKQESNGDIEVDVEIPAEFLLLFYNEQEGDNIGFPMGRIMYGPYKRKLLATELQYIGTERFAIPTPILTAPKKVEKTDSEYLAAVEVMQGFTSAEDSFIIKPEGWELELHDSKFDPTKLSALIKTEDEKISGAILATFLELGTGGNGGAFALGNDLSDFFLNGLEAVANVIRDTMNLCLIPNLIRLNYGEELSILPKLVYFGVSDKAGKEIMEIVTGYTSGGIINSDEQLEDYVRKIHKLPKKAEGTAIENQETASESEFDADTSDVDSLDNSGGSDIDNKEVVLKLADTTGHTHKGTGPAIKRGEKHYHDLLDAKGEASGRTKTEKETSGHVHIIDGETMTSKPIKSTEVKELKENPKALIDLVSPEVTEIIRRNTKNISDKYINDIMKNYAQLGAKQKLNATKNVKIGGVNAFKKELKASLTGAAKKSLAQARKEVPEKSNVKLGYDMKFLRKHFKNVDTFKFSDFSDLPRHIQILVSNQSLLLSEAEAKKVADTVAFQFNSSESSTNDPELIRSDMHEAADKSINSGTKDTAAATVTSTIVNEARNEFLLSPEVASAVASFTFVNSEPKSDICKRLNTTVYSVNSQELVRYQPPLHQNAILSGSMISTPVGLTPIEDIKNGDMVLTHTGEFHKVYDTMDRFEDKQYYEMELDCGKIINITGEHPVLTSRGWIQMDEVQLSDNIVCVEDIKNG